MDETSSLLSVNIWEVVNTGIAIFPDIRLSGLSFGVNPVGSPRAEDEILRFPCETNLNSNMKTQFFLFRFQPHWFEKVWFYSDIWSYGASWDSIYIKFLRVLLCVLLVAVLNKLFQLNICFGEIQKNILASSHNSVKLLGLGLYFKIIIPHSVTIRSHNTIINNTKNPKSL